MLVVDECSYLNSTINAHQCSNVSMKRKVVKSKQKGGKKRKFRRQTKERRNTTENTVEMLIGVSSNRKNHKSPEAKEAREL